jgi:hypothetical protein
MSSYFSITDFSTYFKGGARSYLFEWSSPNIGGIFSVLNEEKMLVKATTLPETTVEEHIVEYQQLNFKMAGKKTFNDWTVSFVMDRSGSIRLKFEKWMNKIHNINSNNGPFQQNYYDKYIEPQMTFKMLNYGLPFETGTELIKITLHNVWPKSIGPVTLDYSSQDFAQFDVTFSYLYHYMDGSEVPIE